MPFSLNFRRSRAHESVSPPARLSRPKHCRLDFWYIEPRDREDLKSRIMPYMSQAMSKKDLLETVLHRYSWSSSFLISEECTATENGAATSEATTVFWHDPSGFVDRLLGLTRFWFFTLLRYSYRVYFLASRERSRKPLSLEDLQEDRDDLYESELSDHEIKALVGASTKHGASFYRRRHRQTQKRLAWTKFCAEVMRFCASVGLKVSTRDPEVNLLDLRESLTSIVLNRNSTLRLEVPLQAESLPCPQAGPSRSETEATSQFTESRVTNDQSQEEEASKKAEEIDRIMQSLRTQYDGQLDDLRRQLGDLTLQYVDGESLLACRWLLEHIPLTKSSFGEGGRNWKQFWQQEWRKSQGQRPKNHVLHDLVLEQKYYSIGGNLYRTLSNRLHQYGERRGESLNADVQRVVDTIKPVNYLPGGTIDLRSERRRWLL